MRASILLRSALAFAWLVGCTDRSADKPPAGDPTAASGAAVDDPKPGLPAAEELLAATVVALGGAASFEAIHSFYIESKMDMQQLGLTGIARTWWADGAFYSETEMPGVGLVRIGGLDGKVWSDDPINGMRIITGAEAEQAAWSTSRCLALDWQKYFKSVTTTAIVEDAGKRLAELTFTSPSGDEVVLQIDMESKLPVSQRFRQANPLGAMPVSVTFSDFREVAGTKVAYSQFVDASLTKMNSTIDKFEVNVEVGPERFAIPGPKAIALPAEAAEPPPSERPPAAASATK